MEYKKNKKRILKLICLVAVIMLITLFVKSTYAAINPNYVVDTLVRDTSEQVGKKTLASILLDALSSLVYALASLGEWLIGKVFLAVSGTNIFPWADAIIFNAIPLLDINFLTPSEGSLVGTIQEVLAKMYGTIFVIAIGFFGISILIMGVKLAISTIASEKAKYKTAIVNWVSGIVLLFTMHIFISFVFYLNEQLVIVASTIATNAIDSTEAVTALTFDDDGVSDEDKINSFINAMSSQHITDWTSFGLSRVFDGIGRIDITLTEAKEIINENPKIAASLLQDERYRYWRFGDRNNWYTIDTSANSNFWTWSRGDKDFIRVLAENVRHISQGRPFEEELKELSNKRNRSEEENRKLEFYIACDEIYNKDVLGQGGSQKSLAANLAQYFKEAAWEVETGSWKASKIVIQNAILYAILVVQSFMFLLSYIKRVFFVIILALLAPAVVVYDFFNKSFSG